MIKHLEILFEVVFLHTIFIFLFWFFFLIIKLVKSIAEIWYDFGGWNEKLNILLADMTEKNG